MNFYLVGNRAKVEELNEKKQEPIIAEILAANISPPQNSSALPVNDADLA